MIKDYKLVSSQFITDLESMVRAEIEMGWQPYMAPFNHNGILVQAMTRDLIPMSKSVFFKDGDS